MTGVIAKRIPVLVIDRTVKTLRTAHGILSAFIYFHVLASIKNYKVQNP